jgi:hypothetical protein
VGKHGARIVDRSVVELCLQELDRLSYAPCHPPAGSPVSHPIILLDESGARVAAFGFGCVEDAYIVVTVPGAPVRTIEYERSPNVGRLLSYAQALVAHRGLREVSARPQWDEDDVLEAKLLGMMLTDALADQPLRIPHTPSALRRALDELPPLSPSPLSRYSDALGGYAAQR